MSKSQLCCTEEPSALCIPAKGVLLAWRGG